ncbi:mitotic fidelity of chromosome transmission- protein [Coniosporium tulheliwenetii]|uniref:Mitotic fidelity of chromosome transmission-protein n=1 Tax=Coniosporium tulheliwenetii TaxID=3383036 RepID=A0ACC2Z2B0_9PEZI|nr:mitotic fidelity of chromosome transmission- protein [Cladosporium sp. JES 115]
MAPANTPGRKKRENNFHDIGVQGRKTGITLKDTGIRDEHGFEPIDGMFSSPEKPSPRRTARRTDITLTSEEMEVQQSSMPELTEALSARQLLKGSSKTRFPPPMGRSPIKTSLGSSPRRQSSMGPPSQVHRSANTPSRASSHPLVSRKLDFTADDTIESIEHSSPLQTNGIGSRGKAKARADIYDIQPSPERGQKRTFDESIAEEEEEVEGVAEDRLNGTLDEEPMHMDGDDSLEMLQANGGADEDLVEEEPEVAPAVKTPPKRRGGRPRKSDTSIIAAAAGTSNTKAKGGRRPGAGRPSKNRASLQSVSELPEEPSVVQAQPKRRGRPGAAKKAVDESLVDALLESGSGAEEPSVAEVAEPVKKKRGRQPAAEKQKKGSKVGVHRDDEPDEAPAEEPPAKRRKGAAKKPPPSERDPNAKIRSKKAMEKQQSPVKGSVRSSSQQPSHARSLQILRQGTPMEDDGAKTTRFGRHVIKPLAHWRNERAEYTYDGGIQAIVRAEDIEPQKRSRNYRGVKRRPRAGKREMSVVEEEEEEELEAWEQAPGVIEGFVNGWDDTQDVATEEQESQELAFAASTLETREVANANFQYAKILSLPFFGIGMVDVPPGGFKRAKNTRRMQLAFFVHYGKVSVTVGENEFSISKGGVWQVPRGNTYGIANRGDRPARIFFAQGCEELLEQEKAGEDS